MCFRPASVDQSTDCPQCGKTVNAIMGVYPESCPFCGFKYDPEAMMAGAPSAPGGTVAPKMPSAPVAPKMPGAPKPPSAPGSFAPPKVSKPSSAE